MQKFIDQFKTDASDFTPGLLVLCDLADAKRRNIHLGHLVVDKDIEEFHQLIQEWAGPSGLARRVTGESWLAIGKTDSASSLISALLGYRKQQQIEVGWLCSGKKDSTVKTAERTVIATITRAVRCVYTPVTKSEEVAGLVDELLEQCYGFVPDQPIPLSEAAKAKRVAWKSVNEYPAELPFCPFCHGAEFEWQDGDGAVYSGSGTCKNCGANINIEGVEREAS